MALKFNKKVFGFNAFLIGLIIVEAVLFLFLLSSIVLPSIGSVFALAGSNNVTISTVVEIGNVYPEILSVSILNGASINLAANSTTNILVQAIIRDYNGEGDIRNVSSRFFDNVASSFGAADDNNTHYTNNTCLIVHSYGDAYEANATCRFNVQYYANNATWNASVYVSDNASRTDLNSTTSVINTLLALGVPGSINYGRVNASEVSDERNVNITNFGNVRFNLTLEGYASSFGDGWAMNCSIGGNISIGHEKYNLTSSIPGVLSLNQFELNYTNLTSAQVVRKFDIPFRQNDAAPYIDDTNSTYWRIYIPRGAAGNCTGNIVVGAVQSAGA